MTRRAAAALAAVALLVCLAGCGARPVGLTGVGVDASGGLVGYLQVCRDSVDGASLSAVGETSDLGTWRAPGPVTGFATWSLPTPAAGWTAPTPLATLSPSGSYSLFGATADDSSSTRGVTFTLEQTAALKPGQVMYDVGSKQGPRVASEATFRADACTLIE